MLSLHARRLGDSDGVAGKTRRLEFRGGRTGGGLRTTIHEFGIWLAAVSMFGCPSKSNVEAEASGGTGGGTDGFETDAVPGQSNPEESATEGEVDSAEGSGSASAGASQGDESGPASGSSGGDTSGGEDSGNSTDTGGSTGGDGEPVDGGNAHDISVRRVSVNQGADSALAQAGAALAGPTVPLVSRRRALVSAWWTLEPSFASREIVGRLTLEFPSGEREIYEHSIYVSAATGADLSTPHFEWVIPPAAMLPGTRYVVSLHETDPDIAPPSMPPRMPEVGWGDLELGPTERRLRIELVPYRHINCGATAHVDAGVVADMEAFLTSYLPVEEVEMEIHSQVNFGGVMFPMDDVLNNLTSLRGSENPASDVFYYGYLNPCEFQAEQYCGGGLAWRDSDGVVVSPGYRVAVGGPPCNTSAPEFADIDLQTMVHELSHNLGRGHVNCSGTEGGVDPEYPYANGLTGTWGWDIRTGEVHEPTDVDFMGYCIAGYDWWSSDYGWSINAEQLISVNLAQGEITASYDQQLLLTVHPDGRRTATLIRVAPPDETDAWVDVTWSDQFETERLPASRVHVADSDAERFVVALPPGRAAALQRAVLRADRGPLEFRMREF